MTIPAAVAKLFDTTLAERLVKLRRELHQHPELSFKEEQTATRLASELEAVKPKSVARVAKTGLVARIAGRDQKAPVVAVRGDIDALPIQEATGLEFSSKNDGVMHACGHDVHATWTIGAANLLARNPARGDVLVVLQPAEEIGDGAAAILKSGAIDDARAIFGGHVDRRFEVGQCVAQEGPLAASADTFHIVLHGRGAHGARPHESRDPVIGLGALIGAMQTIVARRVNPSVPAVVTIGKVHAGTAPNIIPETAELRGTLRAVDPETRALLADEVKRIAQHIAETYGLKAEAIVHDNGSPPIVNPPQPTAWARAAAESLVGAENVVPLPGANMGGEDFAFYMERMPGCFLRIGAREPGGQVIPAHSPYFYAAEECIFVGAAILAESARRASEALANGN
jgi:hippurate hydrolase